MKRFLTASAIALAAALLYAACGGDDSADPDAGGCETGTEVFCKCPGGVDGTKTCLEGGQSFGECKTLDGPCPELPDTTSLASASSGGFCDPGGEVACRCEDGESGTRTCNAAGDAFGPCSLSGSPCTGASTTTSSTSQATTTATTGTGTPTGDDLLFTPCTNGADCKTGVCEMGMCTLECGSWLDCQDDGGIQGECVRLQNGTAQLCAPYCTTQQDCINQYGQQSRCGFGVAPDDPTFGFTACANWGNEVAVPPLGWACQDDIGCHLNFAGAERICYFEVCTEGCYVADDCPTGTNCSSNGSNPGTCG